MRNRRFTFFDFHNFNNLELRASEAANPSWALFECIQVTSFITFLAEFFSINDV